MGYQTIFFTIAIIVLTYYIKKLNLPIYQKKIIYICCFALFCLIFLIQKFKETPQESIMNNFELQTYTLPPINSITLSFQYKIPQINDAVNIFEQDLEIKLNPALNKGPLFTLIYGSSNTGKTTSTLQYAKYLISQGGEVIYIDLKSQPDKKNVELLLKQSSYQVFKTFLAKANSQNTIPTIFIDHFEVITNISECVLCNTLRKLYMEFQVNIVVISSNALAKQLFYQYQLSKLAQIKLYKRIPQQMQVFFKELIQQINNVDQQKKIDLQQMESCEKHMEFKFELFDEFINNFNKFKTYYDFCKYKLQETIKKVYTYKNTQIFLKALLELQYNKETSSYENKWISYGEIKSYLSNQNIDDYIQQGIQLQLIDTEPGYIRFFTKSIYSASIQMVKNLEIEQVKMQFDL